MPRPLCDLSEYVGLPFSENGLDRRGLHCWGLVRLVLNERCGIDLPAYGDISADDLMLIARRMADGRAEDEWTQVHHPRAFDVVLMRAAGRAVTVHCGIMADHARVLHVEAATDSVIVPLLHPMIRHRLAGFYRHSSISEGMAR